MLIFNVQGMVIKVQQVRGYKISLFFGKWVFIRSFFLFWKYFDNYSGVAQLANNPKTEFEQQTEFLTFLIAIKICYPYFLIQVL